jgi:hypothetical protein
MTNVPTDLRVDDVLTFDEFVDDVEAILPVPERGLEFLETLIETAEGDGPDGFRAESLVNVKEDVAEINKREAHRLAHVAGFDVSYRTVSEWVNNLEDCGLFEAGDYEQRSGVAYSQDVATLKSALLVISSNDSFKVAALQRLEQILEQETPFSDWLKQLDGVLSLSAMRCDIAEPPD